MSTDTKGHSPSAIDKWLLVRYKKYATKAEIPATVSSIMMRRVHDRARVHVSIGMMFLAGLGMFGNALYGKWSAQHGDTIENKVKGYQMEYNKRKEEEERKKQTQQ